MRYSTLLFMILFITPSELTGTCLVVAAETKVEFEKIILQCPTSNTEHELKKQVDIFAASRAETPRISMIVAAPKLTTLRFAADDFEPGPRSDDGIMAIIQEHVNEKYSQLSMNEIVLRRLRIGSQIQYAFCCSTTGTEGRLDVILSGPDFTYGDRSALRQEKKERVRLLWLSSKNSSVFQWSHLRIFGHTEESPSCSKCETLLREVFGSRIPSYSDIDIRIRDDLWFDGSGYPLVFKFIPTAFARRRFFKELPGQFRLPTVNEYYYLGREVWCRMLKDRKTISCDVSGRWSAEDHSLLRTHR